MPSKKIQRRSILGVTVLLVALTIIYFSVAPVWAAHFNQKAIHKIVHVTHSVPVYELAGTNEENYHLEQVNGETSELYKHITLTASARMTIRSKGKADAYYLVRGRSGTKIGYVATKSVAPGPTKYHLPKTQTISFAGVKLPWKIDSLSGSEADDGVTAWRGNGSNTNSQLTYYLGNTNEDIGFGRLKTLKLGASITTVDAAGVQKRYRVFRVIAMDNNWQNVKTDADEWLYMANHLHEQVIALQTSLNESGTTNRVVFAK